MRILFLYGSTNQTEARKAGLLRANSHNIFNPKLDEDDFTAAVQTAQAEYDLHDPDVIVGSSWGGAVAMNIDSKDTPLVLLCPAWKKWGSATTVKRNTTILHSQKDDVVPFNDSEELVSNSGLPSSALIEIGNDHLLADAEPLEKMLEACKHLVSTTARCQEQLKRIHRWFERIYSLMNETTTKFDRDAESYADDFHAFFIECHSMMDWLVNDPVCACSKEDVKDHIRKNDSLRFCADLANGKKHFYLDRPWNEDEAVQGLAFSFAVSNGDDTTCDTGSDRLGAARANEVRDKWIECGVDPNDITIAVFADVVVNGAPSGDPFDGAVELAWDAYEAWCKFLDPDPASEEQ